MKTSAILLVVFLGLGQLQGQPTLSVPRTVIVIPFENASSAPGLEWISEAFPIILGQRLSSPTTYVFTRNDRIRAYDRAGIPSQLHPTRATVYRIVEQMDVDYAVLGRFTFDGKAFTCTAQMLDMKRQKLLPEYSESGPLPELIRIQNMLAWDLLHAFGEPAVSRDSFINSAPPLRLDAFENYVRGLLTPTGADKIRYLQQAVRLNPTYNEAWLELGKAFFDDRQYAQAVSSLAQVAQSDPACAEANFYLGLAAFYQNDFPRAESAFSFVSNRMPLPEVYNNLGVVNARRGNKSATGFFQKSVQQDPNDADYRFNLGVALYVAGDASGAAQQLKPALALTPSDSEARALLDSVSGATKTQAGIVRIPPERIRRNYDESSFRQLFFGIQAASEARLGKTDPRTHARFLVTRGQELLAQGFLAEAGNEFREAARLNPSDADAHAGLARVLEASDDSAGARAEAQAAIALKPMVDPFLVLARLDLRDNKTEAAAQSIDRALKLDPANPSALSLRRAVAAKLAEKAQPLPN
jgi:tetratricopeptide (TPR) repeat protein/TolB-like protein